MTGWVSVCNGRIWNKEEARSRTCLGVSFCGLSVDRQASLVMNFGIIEVPGPHRAGHNRGHGLFALAAD
jgi:hypothetical protein